MKPFKHLLVIRLSAMGDVAMTVPIIKALREQYPETKITFLTRAFFAPLFTQLPGVTVYTADVKGKHKGILGLYRLYRELRAQKIDAVADLHHVLRSNILKLFFRSGGFQVVQIDKGRADKKALVSGRASGFKPLQSTHERYQKVFERLGFALRVSSDAVLPRQALGTKEQRILGNDGKRIIGIAPFAAFQGKMYPLHLMDEVVSRLNETHEYRVLLFGGGEKELEQLSLWAAKYENVTNASEQLAFKEELGLISNVDLMLAMDSGNGHLSAMYGVPTLTLWGVTHPYAGFTPFAQPPENSLLADRKKFPAIPTSVYGNSMPKGYESVMETISPETILKKIEAITNK